MIEMQSLDGRVVAALMCDNCGKRIDDIGMGLVKFGPKGLFRAEDGTPAEYVIVHKVSCDKGFRDDLKYTWELSTWLVRVLANSLPPDDRSPEGMMDWLKREVDLLGRLRDAFEP